MEQYQFKRAGATFVPEVVEVDVPQRGEREVIDLVAVHGFLQRSYSTTQGIAPAGSETACSARSPRFRRSVSLRPRIEAAVERVDVHPALQVELVR